MLVDVSIDLQDPLWRHSLREDQQVYVETDVGDWPMAYTRFAWKELVQDIMHYSRLQYCDDRYLAAETAYIVEDLCTMARRRTNLERAPMFWCALSAVHLMRCGQLTFCAEKL